MDERFADPATMKWPFPCYKSLQDERRCFFSKGLKSFAVTRFADVEKIALDEVTFLSLPDDSEESGDMNYYKSFQRIYHDARVPVQTPNLVRTGGDLHRRYRRLVDRYFSPSAVKEMEPHVVARSHG